VGKVICHKAPCRIDGWFNVIRQVTATCPPMRAHWRHLANTIELVLPSAHTSPQPKRQMDRFSHLAQLMAQSAYTLQWAPLSTRIAPSHRDLDLPCNMMLCAHASPQPKRHLDWFSRVCTDDRSVPIWFACFALKIVPSHVGIWTSCNTWFIGPIGVRNANGNLIVSAVFAGLTSVTD